MSIVLALLAALLYGAGDFSAGLASRRLDFRVVCVGTQSVALIATAVAVVVYPGDGPTGSVVLWGAIAGVVNGAGAMSLYHGLAVGRMSIVATLSGLTSSVVPVLVGIVQGDSLSALSAVGIAIAVPAIALVSWQPADVDEERPAASGAAGSGALWGFIAGLCFAVFFISIDQAGNDSGAWPVAVNQLLAVLVPIPFAARVMLRERPRLTRPGLGLTLGGGIGIGLATLALLGAFESGELAIVVILVALYPGITALLARFVLHEHWVRTQKIGLLAALAAVVLVSAGSG